MRPNIRIIVLTITLWHHCMLVYSARRDKISLKLCTTNIEGAACEITCKVPDFNKTVSIYKPGGQRVLECKVDDAIDSLWCTVEKAYRDEYTDYRRNKTAKTVSLTIPSLDKDKHGGIWHCGHGSYDSARAEFEVFDPPIQQKPTTYIEADEGENITLICDVDPRNQGYRIKWFYNHDEILDTKDHKLYYFLDVPTRSLTIKNVDKNSKGYYKCLLAVPETGTLFINGSINYVYKVNRIEGILEKNQKYEQKVNDRLAGFQSADWILVLINICTALLCIILLVFVLKVKSQLDNTAKVLNSITNKKYPVNDEAEIFMPEKHKA